MSVLSSELGPPTPSSASGYVPTGTKWGDTHFPAGEGLGESQFGRLEKRLSTLSGGGGAYSLAGEGVGESQI